MKIFKPILLFVLGSLSLSQDIFAAAELKVPKENVNFWNLKSSIQDNNNCYNYATNRITNDFAQPGDASRNIFTEHTCDDVYKAAASDLGLEPTNFFEFQTVHDDTLIALVVEPGVDFHWYRRDQNNTWSHKPGNTPATRMDNKNHPITSPETADRGPYKDFCGYFKIKNFPTNKAEQNAGYVRIGNMKKLPQDPLPKGTQDSESYIELQKYSGRRNPRIPLKQILTLMPELQQHSALLKKTATLESFSPKTFKLGDENFILSDKDGHLADKNTFMKINFVLTAAQIKSLHQLFSGK
jgi:hypothetical protein